MSKAATPTNRARGALGLAPAEGTALTPLDQRITYIRSLAPAFTDAVAAGLTPETLVRDAITAVRNTPELVECEPQSFAGALMSAAQLGLRPNVPSLGHGWVLPFWSGRRQRREAQWVLGYQGMVELGYKSGLVSKITTDTIYSNEHYRVRRGTADELVHEPVLDEEARGEPIAHYAIVWLQTGQCLWRVMPDADVRRIRDRMAAKDRAGNIVGPWRDDYQAMAQKTPLRALWRFMPKTPILALALTTDGALREGTEKDAAVIEPDAAVETVDAEVVPDPPAPATPEGEPAAEAASAEPQQAADSPAAPEGPYTLANGDVREPVAITGTRKAYIERILAKHEGHVRAVTEQVVGEWIPPGYLTTAELKQLAHADYDAPPA